MKAVLAWLQQPSTLMFIGVIVGAGVYWFTGNANTALLIGALIPGAMNDHTKTILARVEAVEDAVKSKPAAPADKPAA